MDLTFKLENKRIFNVRSVALLKFKEHYLLSKREDKDYYSIPGGRITYNEDSKEAVLRELREELGWQIQPNIAKLIRIIENFYYYKDNTYFHEYLFVYLIEVSQEIFNKGDFINLENPLMHMEWHAKKDFLKLNIKPNIIKDIDDTSLKHIINKENYHE